MGGNQIPGEWHQWRGKVDGRLENVEASTQRIEKKVDDMPNKIEGRIKKALNENQPRMPAAVVSKNQERGEPITFKWLAEKAFLPILLGLAMAAIGYMLASGG